MAPRQEDAPRWEVASVNDLNRLRSAQGVVGLANTHDVERLNAACCRTIEVGDPPYKAVKGILTAGTEHDGEEPPSAPTAPAHLHDTWSNLSPTRSASPASRRINASAVSATTLPPASPGSKHPCPSVTGLPSPAAAHRPLAFADYCCNRLIGSTRQRLRSHGSAPIGS